MIVDAHVHVVAGDRESYPFQPSGIANSWYLEPNLTVEDYRARMAAAGVDAAVLVQAFGPYGPLRVP
jgi:predicted TIM-barrel fold metal-dependent hydrolase